MLDATVVALGIVDAAITGPSYSALRAVRVLRPLRTITHVRGLRVSNSTCKIRGVTLFAILQVAWHARGLYCRALLSPVGGFGQFVSRCLLSCMCCADTSGDAAACTASACGCWDPVWLCTDNIWNSRSTDICWGASQQVNATYKPKLVDDLLQLA